MNVKELFEKAEGGTLTYEQFTEMAKSGKAKFVDLSEGNYVSKQKYDDDLASKDTQITDLNKTISDRETDLQGLQKKLEDAGTDSAKLTELNGQLATLKTQYEADTQSYKDKLSKQAYEFAVKDFANGKKFTSQAAKRDFISSLINENLKLDEHNGIMGANDFVTKYSESNADAFVIEKEEPTTPPAPVPTFVAPTPGPDLPNEGGFNFNFTGVREHPVADK